VAAPEIGTIDQEAADASGAHFGEGDFLAGQGGHALLKRGPPEVSNPSLVDQALSERRRRFRNFLQFCH
jgi:hypothetical protein